MRRGARLHFFRAEDIVAGVDEAGRGPLAGPVVAAAVILDPARPLEGVADSKCLSASRRRVLAREIRRSATAFALALAEPAEIDTCNILRASLRAMARAVGRLRVVPYGVQVDGNQLPRFANRALLAEPIVGGDRSVAAISAASILAKVCRDRVMDRWHRRYPVYGFDHNRGYATAEHLAALERYGPCPIHRLSFAPVARARERGIA